MSASQIPTSVTIIDSLHGFMGLSLTEYATSAAAAIAAGSVVEVAGAFFTFVADDTPEASTWTSITTGTTAYIALTPSGTAGSQILSATYTSTAPTWRDDLQGWYASAASSTRIVASVYKAESTSYYPKYILAKDQELSFSGGMRVRGVLSVSSSISVVEGASIGGSLSVTGGASVASALSVGGGMLGPNYIRGTSISNGSIFSALNTFIPTTGQTILLTGGIGGFPASSAERVSGTQMTVYYVNTTALVSLAVSSGSAATNPWALAW